MKMKCLLALCVLLIFGLVASGPALTQTDELKGVCVGGGEWTGLSGDGMGQDHFDLRANFPGNASGGKVFVQFDVGPYEGFYVLIDSEPQGTALLYRDEWFLGVGDPVSGYAMWGFGPIIATNNPEWEDDWGLAAAVDAGDRVYLLVAPGMSEGLAEYLYNLTLGGGQPLNFLVYQSKGNAIIKVQE